MIDTNQVRAGLDKGVPADPGHLIDLARDLCDALDVQDEARRMAVGRCDELRSMAARWVREGQCAVEAIERVRAYCNEPDRHQALPPYYRDRVLAALDGPS